MIFDDGANLDKSKLKTWNKYLVFEDRMPFIFTSFTTTLGKTVPEQHEKISPVRGNRPDIKTSLVLHMAGQQPHPFCPL